MLKFATTTGMIISPAQTEVWGKVVTMVSCPFADKKKAKRVVISIAVLKWFVFVKVHIK